MTKLSDLGPTRVLADPQREPLHRSNIFYICKIYHQAVEMRDLCQVM